MNTHDEHLALPDSLRAKFATMERRLWRTETTAAVCGALLGLAVSFGLLFFSDRLWDTPAWLRTALTLAGLAALGWFALGWGRHWVWNRRDWRSLSMIVQREFPRLGDRLLGIVELSDESKRPAGMSASLCRAAILQVGTEAERFDFTGAVNPRLARGFALGLAVALVPLVLAGVVVPEASWNAFTRWVAPVADIPRYTFVEIANLPDRLVVPHGEAFEVGFDVNYRKFWRPGGASARFESQQRLASRVNAGRVALKVPAQTRDGFLKIRVGDVRRNVAVAPTHRPALKSLQAMVALPAYLRHPTEEKLVQNATMNVLEGSSVVLSGTVNRELTVAQMRIENDAAAALEVIGDSFRTSPLKLDGRSHAGFTWSDKLGLDVTSPWVLSLQTQKDLAPRVDIPDLSTELSILETDVLPLRILASDDFGVKESGFAWEVISFLDSTNVAPKKEFRSPASTAMEKRLTNAFAFSPAVMRIPPDSTVELKAQALDFLPGRTPSESQTFRINIVSIAKHAELVRQQLEAIFARLEEITRQEEGIENKTTDLKRLSEEKMATEETATKAGEQADEQAKTARQLDQLAQEGVKAVAEALRNPTFKEQQLKEWTEALQQMKNISQGDMKQAQQSLKSAQKSPTERAEQLAKAQEAEQNALDNLQELQKKMNESLDSLQALTLAQRLRKLAGTEQDIGGKINRMVPDTIGLLPKELPPRLKKANDSLVKDQGTARNEAQTVQEEMSRFFERTQSPNYGVVSIEMKQQNVGEELDRVRKLIDANISMEAMGGLATWTKKFNSWAEVLDPPSDDGGGGGGGGGGEDLLKLLMAYVRMRGAEFNIHERTRLVDEQKDVDPGFASALKKLAEQQRDLRSDLTKMQLENRLNPLIELLVEAQDATREAESKLFENKSDESARKPQMLAVQHFSDIINLINEQIQRGGSSQPSPGDQAAMEQLLQMIQQMQPGMGPPGQNPGGSLMGGTTDRANSGTPGDGRGGTPGARGTTRSSGITRPVPAEFREALENFYRAVEKQGGK